jgi:hypothetical protein
MGWNLISNTDFECGQVTGWAGQGTNPGNKTVAIDSTSGNAYFGNNGLKITTTTTGGDWWLGGPTTYHFKAGATYTISGYIKANTSRSVGVGLYDGVSESLTSFSATSSWQRFTATRTISGSATFVRPMIRDNNAVLNNSFWIDGIKVEYGSTATEYSNARNFLDDGFITSAPGPRLEILRTDSLTALGVSSLPLFKATHNSTINQATGVVALIASNQFQSTLGAGAVFNSYYEAMSVTVIDNYPNNGDHIGICSTVAATHDRYKTGNGTTGDLWAFLGYVQNNGKNTNGIAMELNPENSNPNNDYSDNFPIGMPNHFMVGIQLYPEDIYPVNTANHVSRGINIIPSYATNAGWHTGINIQGFVDNGLFLDSQITGIRPQSSDTPEKNAICFGQHLTNLFLMQRANSTGNWKFMAPADGSYLSFQSNVVGAIRTVRVASAGNGYGVGNQLTIQGGTTNATANVLTIDNGVISQVAVVAGGSNYAVGNILYLIDGTAANGRVQVAQVSGGTVQTVTVYGSGGFGYSSGTKTTVAVSGSGSGCTINIQAVTNGCVTEVTLNTRGAGYTPGVKTTTGGNGTCSLEVTNLINTTGTDLLVLHNLNKIGVGTTSPNAKLEVVGTLVMNGTYANLDPVAGIDISFLKNSAKMLIGWNRTAGEGEADFLSNSGPVTEGGFAFYNMNNSGTLSQLFRIKGGGSVGIGTPNPNSLLDVTGPADDSETNFKTSSTYTQLVLHDSDTSTAGLKLGYRFQNGVTEYGRIQTFNSVGATPLAINPNGGNIGVGVTNPGDKFSVGNKILVTDASSAGSITVPTGGVTIFWDGTNLKAKRASDGKVSTLSPSWA